MSDVRITPGSGLLQFKNASDTNTGYIQISGDDITIGNNVGSVLIGDVGSDVYIGDGVNSIDMIFEQDGAIRAEAGQALTLTLGSADTTLRMSGLPSKGSEATSVMIDSSGNLGYRELATVGFTGNSWDLTFQRSGVNVDTVGADSIFQTRKGTETNQGTWPGSYYYLVSFGDRSAGIQFAKSYGTGTALYFRGGTDNSSSENGGNTYTNWRQLWSSTDFSSTNISNWNTAYGWGNHASQGYLTASSTQSKYLRSDANDSYNSNITATANDWYLWGLGARGASAGQYGIGNGDTDSKRQLTFHVPNRDAFGGAGTVPSFGWYSNGGVQLMKLESASGNLWTKGTAEFDGRVYADNGVHVRGDWVRVDGNRGIYFEGWGGGWYMTDSTYVRAYGDKRIYTASTSRYAIHTAGGMDAVGDMHAARFVDRNDTNYYVNPASTSNVNTVTASQITTGQLNGLDPAVYLNAADRKIFTGINAASQQAKRYLIGRVYYCPAHWDDTWQNMDIRLVEESYSGNYIDYHLFGYYNGSQNQTIDLRVKDYRGLSTDLARYKVVLGAHTSAGWEHSGQPVYYTDLFVEVSYYKQLRVTVSTYGHSYQSSNPTSGAGITVLYNTPTAENITYTNETKDTTYVGLDTKIWNSANVDPITGATVSNDTITFTRANGGTFSVTTSDANTNTWRPVSTTADAENYSVVFYDSEAGEFRLDAAGEFAYDPSTNVLRAGAFDGALTGNAATATNADTVDSLHASSFFRRDTSNDVNVRLAASDGRGLRFWDSDSYKIYMSAVSSTSWGGRVGGEPNSDYNMYFRMSGGTNRGFVFRNGTNNVAGIDASGNGRFEGDVVAYSASDRRLKDNLKPIENACDKVQKLTGYEFDWNENQNVYQGHDIGVVAQEVEEVFPEVVEDRASGYKGVKYEKLVAVLIEANKELQDRVKQLEERIDGLTK